MLRLGIFTRDDEASLGGLTAAVNERANYAGRSKSAATIRVYATSWHDFLGSASAAWSLHCR